MDLAIANAALQVEAGERQLPEANLKQLNAELETEVARRTMDLASANEQLRRSLDGSERLQEQLRRSQKMESIGALAGGVAHNFNNLLNIVHGYLGLMRNHLNQPAKLDEDIEAIGETVTAGAALVRQLLTIARKNEPSLSLTDINNLITGLAKLLSDTFTPAVCICVELNPSLPPIRADANQLHQILLNLCLNARDAMADSGNLRLSTTIVSGDQLRGRFPNIDERGYVCIAVADNGAGIDETIRERIFEPFFTTKGGRGGTGLGLSAVYGIVKGHRGFIDLDSKSGGGTTFRIYLPQ